MLRCVGPQTTPTDGYGLVVLSPHSSHVYLASLYIKSIRPRVLRPYNQDRMKFRLQSSQSTGQLCQHRKSVVLLLNEPTKV
jgi:hypothetical protein